MPAPAPSTRTLSKSDYTLARTCDTKLFFRESRYPDNNASNDYLQLLAVGGYMVEALACAKRPEGILLEYGKNPAEDFQQTLEYLKRDTVTLFQATLLWNRRMARVDILEKRGNVIRLLEVKAKSFDGAAHLESIVRGERGVFRGKRKPYAIASEWLPKFEDVAYQTIILQNVRPDVTVEPFLILVDKSKRAALDDLPRLFEIERRSDALGNKRVHNARFLGTPDDLAVLDLLTEVDVANEVAELRDAVDAEASRFEAQLDEPFAVPLTGRGAKCGNCEFRPDDPALPSGFAMCWGDLASVKPHALELFSIGKVKNVDGTPLIESMVNGGRASLFDIPEELLVKKDGTVGPQAERQLRQIRHSQTGDAWVGPRLRAKLESLTYPLHFIDFEASRIALPYHAKMRPYGQVAFQWSVHTLDSPSAVPRHREWLNNDDVWPNMAFAQSLRSVVGDTGSVLTWSAFEKSTLRDTSDEHDRFVERDRELVSWIDNVIDSRLFDLLKCANDDFYHPGMRGRTSIKVVLDALWKSDQVMREQFTAWTGTVVSEFEDPYHALPALVIDGVQQEVHEGTGAVRAYEAMMYGVEKNDVETKALWRSLLLQYCKLDTLSMVLVFEHWRRVTGMMV